METSDGFTYEAKLTVGEVLDGESAAERGFVAASCEFDEQRDAVVPWKAALRNTTPRFDLDLNLGIAWSDPESAREYAVGMDSDFEHGCGEPDGGVPGSFACCNLFNPNELAPDDVIVTSGGFILHEFYSPREPEGDTSLLSELRFEFSPTLESCLSGPGVGGGYFTLDGTDLSRFEGEGYGELPRVPRCTATR